MRLWLLALMFILALAGCDEDRPDTIRILDIERRGSVPVPPLSELRAGEPVALAVSIPLASVAAVVERAPRIELFVFACGREGRGYTAELFGDGLPLGREWERVNFEPRPPMPKTVTLLAFVPREALDGDGYGCARFFERTGGHWGGTSISLISNAARIRGVSAGVETSPRRGAN